MTQWSPVKGANLLVDPRARQRKERREKRYSPPPVPPSPPAPLLSVSAKWMSERASDRAVIHPGVWPTTSDTYILMVRATRTSSWYRGIKGARRPPRAPPAARRARAAHDRPAPRAVVSVTSSSPGILDMKPGSYTISPDSTIEVHLVLGPDAGAMAIGTHVSVTLTVAAGSLTGSKDFVRRCVVTSY